jgi:hypothetical protein
MSACSYPGCEKPIKAYGLCAGHRFQQVNNIPLRPILRTVEDRFWAKVDRRGNDECWEWTGHFSASGYGFFQNAKRGKTRPAHRIAYELHFGITVAAELQVDHRCRNRRCVNVNHLQLVSNKENQENRGLSKNNTSGYRGVSWHRRNQKWQASICHNGQTHYLGYFDTVESAAHAAREARLKYFTNNLIDREHE